MQREGGCSGGSGRRIRLLTVPEPLIAEYSVRFHAHGFLLRYIRPWSNYAPGPFYYSGDFSKRVVTCRYRFTCGGNRLE